MNTLENYCIHEAYFHKHNMIIKEENQKEKKTIIRINPQYKILPHRRITPHHQPHLQPPYFPTPYLNSKQYTAASTQLHTGKYLISYGFTFHLSQHFSNLLCIKVLIHTHHIITGLKLATSLHQASLRTDKTILTPNILITAHF